MRHSQIMRLLALMLALLTLIGPVAVRAEGEEPKTGEEDLVALSEDLIFISYQDYKIKYLDVPDETYIDEAMETARGKKTFSFSAADYLEEGTTAEVEAVEHNGRECLSIGEEGVVTWKFDVPETGFYSLSFNYCSDSQRTNSIEKIFYINEKVPFQETRYVALNKLWKYNFTEGYVPGNGLDSRDGAFSKDAGGNEIRPRCTAVTDVWLSHTMHDRDGYISGPFEYYLKEGENTISLESVGDYCFIDEFTFGPIAGVKSYEEYCGEHADAKEPEDAEPIYINAELPAATSDFTIYPATDHTSAISEPQDATLTVYNTIGGDKWLTNGQWVRYTFNVEKAGLYTINPRFKQSINEGIFSSRSLKIDGEIPFEEAASLRFPYDDDWQIAPLSDDNGDTLRFYFEPGEHTIEFEACLGDTGIILQQAMYIKDSLNTDYNNFSRLTGTDPDTNRNYGFMRIMPDTVADLSIQSQNLKIIMSNINQTSGIKSENTSSLEEMIELLRKMGADETKIAANMTSFQSQVSSFGEWIANMAKQPLELDYILIQPESEELPDADANFFQSFIYEVKKFFASFFADYDSITDDTGDKSYAGELTVWTTSGREQAQIMNTIIKNGFTSKTDVLVNLKLVAGGTLIPAILAGTAPDVTIDAMTPLEYAIRGAALPLNDYDTFDEVMARFPESAVTQLSLYGEVFAVPVNMGVPVMFYRSDILADLGLSVPETWDDLMSMVPVFQFNKMEVGVPFDFQTFIFQNDARWWKDDGMRIAFDETPTLDAFETICNYFTQYSLPVQFNGITRMKMGEMPIFIGPYNTYNTLVVSAPEISGLWAFAQVPGVKRIDENGNEYVDHTVAATSSGIIMPRTARDRELAWDFMDWYTDKDPQIDFCNEMVALLGPSAKQAVANKEAFNSLPWTAKEREVLRSAFDTSKEIEVYPGDYIVARYYNFAFNKAYNEKKDPSDSLLEYVTLINTELSRKRKEFGLMVAEEWDAVKEFTGLDSYYDTTEGKRSWLNYAKENGIDDYQAWMEDNGISAENYTEWVRATKSNETDLSYKDWINS